MADRNPTDMRMVSLPDERLRQRRRKIDPDAEAVSKANPTDEEILTLARKRFKTSAEAESRVRLEMLEDMRFRAGQQWPDQILTDRTLDKRPTLTVNRLPQFIKQITNPQRQMRPTVQVNPVGDGADIDTAEVIQGIVRHIENTSHAEVAIDQAYEDAVTMGRGFFRILTDYVDDGDSFDQEIIVKRIGNPFTVYVDPASMELDYSDARYMFVIEDVPKDEYINEYGEQAFGGLETFQGTGDRAPDWFPEGKVRVAEYWYVEEQIITLALVPGINGQPDRTLPLNDVPKEQRKFVQQKRKAKKRVVHWIKMNAAEILSRQVWPGAWIPIVPVLGDEINIDGRRDLVGVVRYARDPQRMYNYWVPLALDTPIPTPSGWTTMGAVKTGDMVFDNKGRPCAVLGTSPVHEGRDCFKVTFDDGTFIVADREHPWQVEERGHRCQSGWHWTTKVVTTAELTPKQHFIWATKPLMLDDAKVAIDPYVLGVWLSDGRSDSPNISQNMCDIEPLRDALASHGARFGPVGLDGDSHGRFTVNGMRRALGDVGLLNNKHIPTPYLRGSLTQRLSLLQGLMDGDGSVAKKTNVCSFSTGSEAVRDGMAELLRSLGIKAKCRTRKPRVSTMLDGRKVVGKHVVYQFDFTAPPPDAMPVFALPRKFAGQRARNGVYHPRRTGRFGIAAVEPMASVPVKCIGVDSHDHLFLAGLSMVPTHNSAQTETIALAPRAPFIGASGQFKGHEQQWKLANQRNFAYLEYETINSLGQSVPPPQRQVFEPPIRAIVEATRQSDNDLKAVIGFYDASLGQPGPDQSGKAILARQKQGETANINFIDNLGRALWHYGRICLDLIPKIYDTPRVLNIVGLDDQRRNVTINAPHIDAKGVQQLYDVRSGRYGITMSVGPSYQSKRQEAVAAMLQLVQAAPQMIPIMGDLLVKEMDWPVARQISERLKKMLPPQLQEQPQGQNQPQIPPQVQAQMQALMMQHDMLVKVVNDLTETMKSKKMELASKEYIAAMQTRAQMAIALEKVNAQLAQARLEQEIAATTNLMQSNHERLMEELADQRTFAFQSQQQQAQQQGQMQQQAQQQQGQAALSAQEHGQTLQQQGQAQDAQAMLAQQAMQQPEGGEE